jgi:pimeloyl-ACP methyl ester carboxylesterase
VADIWVDDRTLDIDGRTWAVRQAGDPDGVPLVHFHGTPSCRLEPSFADGLCAELGVRLVAFDRPGYGGSSPAPFSLSSIARDTAAIVDRLGIDRFSTTGQSGGGPFSLACGAVLGDRVVRVGVTAGPAPFDLVPGLLDVLDENDTTAFALLPDEAAAAAQFAVGFEGFRQLGHASDADVIAGFRSMCSAHDRDVLDDPLNARAIATALKSALVQGSSGAGWDNVAWVGPWDFELAEVRRPVHLWYGGDDPFSPPVHARWLEEHLPDATMHFREGDGHLGFMEHAREIVQTLVSD